MRRILAILAAASSLALANPADTLKVYHPEALAGLDSVRATIYTSYGPMVFRLFPDKAPQTVANFVALADKKFYDTLSFHRVIPGFMAQGGDPLANGQGGPGWTIKDELNTGLKHDAGALSMANAGPGTAGSQFFIVQVAQPHLDGKHAVFGQIRSGWDVSCLLEQNDRIDSIRISRYGVAKPAASTAPVSQPTRKK
jgi:peptidyl-prolyl cis-trans isomerase B (cyclophilin B)